MDRLFSTESLSHAVSGSLSSILALALVYPLDQVRILKQVWHASKKRKFGNLSVGGDVDVGMLCTPWPRSNANNFACVVGTPHGQVEQRGKGHKAEAGGVFASEKKCVRCLRHRLLVLLRWDSTGCV